MLSDMQQLLQQALLSDDPVAILEQMAKEVPLSEEERAHLAHIEANGILLTSLLITKLRFERLTGASEELLHLFQNDPKQFIDLFNQYQKESKPTAYFPEQEAILFEQWLQNR